MNQTTIPANQARQNFYNLLNQVIEEDKIIKVHRRNGQRVVMMSEEEFESWQETLEIMSDPELMASIKQGQKELKEGKGISWEEVKKDLRI